MHVQGYVDEILRDRFADDVPLVIGGELEEFLAQVVAEWVGHQVSEVTKCFAEDHIAMLRNALLELLLEVTATVLVFAECGYLALEILKASASETVDYSTKVSDK